MGTSRPGAPWIAVGAVATVTVALFAGVAAGDAAAPRNAPWRAIDVVDDEDARLAWAVVRDFFPNLRDGHEHEVWEVDEASAPPARPLGACLEALAESGLSFVRTDRSCRMSAQVRIDDPIEGVSFLEGDGDPPGVEVGCELALRLPGIARVLGALGVRTVSIGHPARAALHSFHRFALAMDVYALTLADGTEIVVLDDYARVPDRGTCEGDPPEESAGRLLRDVACRLFESRLLSTVITPNYNSGHWNHFHLDVRPGDERFYLR